MKTVVNEKGCLTLKELYNPITLESSGGSWVIVERDGGFEIHDPFSGKFLNLLNAFPRDEQALDN